MVDYWRGIKIILAISIVVICMSIPHIGFASTAAEIDSQAKAALQELYKSSPAAAELSKTAKAILVFPNMVKAGLILGAQGGEGELIEGGKTTGYYISTAASFGLQAGMQKFGYALFFMTDSALEYLKKSKGWEIGVGPSVVVVDAGMARSLTTTTVKEDIYAFFFGQKGLMAGMGIQGTKITKYQPDK